MSAIDFPQPDQMSPKMLKNNPQAKIRYEAELKDYEMYR